MLIAFSCPCGKQFQVADSYAGKRTKCTGCGGPLTVPNPPPPPEPEEDEYEVVDDPLPVAKAVPVRAVAAPPAVSKLGASRWADKPAPRPVVADDDEDRPARPKKKKRRASQRSGGGVTVSGGVIAGLFMMLGAVVWLVVGLYFGWLFFYPPVLFIIGLISLIKGLMGFDEE
jgi:hypothetical protein